MNFLPGPKATYSWPKVHNMTQSFDRKPHFIQFPIVVFVKAISYSPKMPHSRRMCVDNCWCRSVVIMKVFF